MKGKLTRLVSGEEGQALEEYALLIALLSLGVVATLIALRTQIVGVFEFIATAFGT